MLINYVSQKTKHSPNPPILHQYWPEREKHAVQAEIMKIKLENG